MGNIRDGAGERCALVSRAFGVVIQGAGDFDGLIGEIAKIPLLAIQQRGGGLIAGGLLQVPGDMADLAEDLGKAD